MGLQNFLLRYIYLNWLMPNLSIEEVTMALTAFGKAVRKARIDTGYTLLTMAKALGTTPAFLSGTETGTKRFLLSGYQQFKSFLLIKSIIWMT